MEKSNTANMSSVFVLSTDKPTTLAGENKNRIFLFISNESITEEVILKLQAASIQNDKKFVTLGPMSSWEMSTNSIYTGEVSAIAKSGNPGVFVTEY